MSTMNADQLAAWRIRQARWLLELAAQALDSTPNLADRVETIRRMLGEIAGDYRAGEVEQWKAIHVQQIGPVH